MPIPKLSNVSSPRGAPMGRPAFRPVDKLAPYKFYLVRVRLDSGGYDSGGAYWGHDLPLYYASSTEQVKTSCWVPGRDEVSPVESYLRAFDREDAKAKLREEYPNARFFH